MQSLPILRPISDSVLGRIAAGDSAAVGECIAQYGGLIWSLARRLTRTCADAEDATQEIFLNIWSSAAAFDPGKGSETVFIALIARRRLIDRRRKRKMDLLIDFSVDYAESQTWSDPGTSPQADLDTERALKALQQLRPEHRKVLELGLMHDLSHAQISAKLQMPLGTVKSHMRRGLLEVREYMKIPAEFVSTNSRIQRLPSGKEIKAFEVERRNTQRSAEGLKCFDASLSAG